MPQLVLFFLWVWTHCVLSQTTYSGYLIDIYCYQLPGSIALDGAPLRTRPQDHTVHCMRDIPECFNNGFAFVENVGTAALPNYVIKYKLDSVGNNLAYQILATTATVKSFVVTATGTVDAATSTLRVTSFVEGLTPASPTPTGPSPNPTPTTPTTPTPTPTSTTPTTPTPTTPTPAPTNPDQVSVTAILIDNYCWQLPNFIALDGANLKTRPQDHTVHCLRDIQECIDSGYALVTNINSPENPRYEILYLLDSKGNNLILERIKVTPTEKNFIVDATGTVDRTKNPPVLRVQTIKESKVSGGIVTPAEEQRPGDPDLVAKGFTRNIRAGCDVDVYWMPVNTSSTSITMAVRKQTSGWVAIGFSKRGTYSMVGTDAVIGWTGMDMQVGSHFLSSKTEAGVTTHPNLVITGTSVAQEAGVTTIIFTRELNSGENPITDLTAVTILTAYHESEDQLVRHSCRAPQALTIDFITGGGEMSGGSSMLKDAHGALMLLGWGVILSYGAIIMRYGKKADKKKETFQLHQAFQISGMCVVTAAFIIALVMVDGSHFSTVWHAQLGLAIMILAYLQFFGGILRPHAKKDSDESTTQRKIFNVLHPATGTILLVTSTINIFLGISILWHYWVLIVFAIFVAFNMVIVVAMEWYFFDKTPVLQQ